MNKIVFLLLFSFLSLSHMEGQTQEELFGKALDYLEAEDYVNAEDYLKQALRQEPTNPANSLLLMNLGTVQRNLGKHDEALMSYTAAMSKFPDRKKLLHIRAALLCEMEKYDEALKDYDAILSLDESDKDALYCRALINMTNSKPEEAHKDFDKLLSINPKNWQASEAKATMLKLQGEWHEAEEVLTDAIYNNKSQGRLYAHRAECYVALRKLGTAQADLSKAKELEYNDSYLYIVWGKLRLQQYDKRAAKESFSKAKELGADEKVVEELLLYCK